MQRRTFTAALAFFVYLAMTTTSIAAPSTREWDAVKLKNALDYARSQKSSALVVVANGNIVAEQYWSPEGASPNYANLLLERGPDGAPVEDVASIQKSLIALMIGMAVDRDMIDLDQPVSRYIGSGWSKATRKAERQITVRHLMTMTSGLTTAGALEAEPGTNWAYNTNMYSKLVPVLESVTNQSIAELTRVWIAEPLGLDDTAWRARPWIQPGMDANPIGLYTTARDLVKVGQLVLAGGNWQGQQLVSEPYVEAMLRPSQGINTAYGYLWWLNGKGLAPAAPGDLVAAQGALGRKLFVVPSLDLVVVRLGAAPEPAFNETLWHKIMDAAPVDPICRECGTPLANKNSEARAAAGDFIHWREHIIDDPARGIADLSGSDGFAIADLDADGFDDIVSVHESDTVYDGKPVGHVRIAWGSADPTSWTLSTLASGPEAAAAEDVTLADFDGDGDIDVVVACELAHLIYFDNPGRSARKRDWKRTIIPITTERGSYIRAFAADFDGDGKPEVAAANKGEQNPDAATPALNNLSLYLPPRDPLDGHRWREQLLGKVRIPINSEPVDLDGDGDLDIVAGSRGEARVLWFENLGDMKFLEHAITPATPADGLAITGFNMEYQDLNGDGRLDVISTAWPGSIVVLFQPRRVSSPWRWQKIGDAAPDQLVSVRAGDIDSDGDLDLMVGAYSRGSRDEDGPLVTVNDPMGRIAWFENPGEQAFPWRRHDISRRKRGMYDKWELRDLDGDGDLDAIGTRGNSEPYDGVIWLEQVRTGAAAPVFEQARPIDSEQMSAPELSN